MKLIIGAVSVSTKYNEFASCLVEKQTKFYGAFWCSHCQAQERRFGMSRDTMEKAGLYIECSNPDRSQNALCQAEKITGYPTWKFADDTIISRELELKELSEKTGCALPSAEDKKK
jgi:hypothetical protein